MCGKQRAHLFIDNRVCNDYYALSVDALRNFCDKMVTSFLPSFLGLILRQRRVNEMGTQQLLLDVYNLKTLMLKVPSLGECT